MLRTALITAAVLLTGTAQAQSFFSDLYGARYCDLRSKGVGMDDAIRVALQEAWTDARKPVYVTFKGKRTNIDVIDGTDVIANTCPQYLNR